MRMAYTMSALAILLTWGCGKDPDADLLSITECSIEWTHPNITNSPPTQISDMNKAQELAAAFGDAAFLRPGKGNPHDCPMYDCAITFKRDNGDARIVKVYLPRERTFPGMWKHPDTGVLRYFDVEKKEPKQLVDILKPHLPVSPVYPDSVSKWPAVRFNKGIPDFRDVHLPIFGDFSPQDFQRGR